MKKPSSLIFSCKRRKKAKKKMPCCCYFHLCVTILKIFQPNAMDLYIFYVSDQTSPCSNMDNGRKINQKQKKFYLFLGFRSKKNVLLACNLIDVLGRVL